MTSLRCLMPYPAKSIDASYTGPWTLNYGNGTVSTFTAGYMRTVQKHPASTSNPMRADGTRHMSGWNHYGGRWRSSSDAYGTLARPGLPTRIYRGCYPAANIDPTKLKVWEYGRDYARLKALATWADRQVEFSDALRQAGDTARMVGDLGIGFTKQLEDSMRRYGGNLARHWKKLPSWYLEYLYGWKPLMDDISNITDRLIQGFDAGNTLHLRLRGVWEGRGRQTVDNVPGNTWGSQFYTDYTLGLEQKNTSVFKYQIPMHLMPNLKPMGFFGGLYEAAPFSHVLDWVAPTGMWLRALDANTLSMHFVEGCSSEVVRVTSVTAKHRPSGTPGYVVGLTGNECSMSVPPFRFSRVLETPLSLRSRVPFRTDLNLQHAAQGLAMLTQVMKRLY